MGRKRRVERGRGLASHRQRPQGFVNGGLAVPHVFVSDVRRANGHEGEREVCRAGGWNG